MNRRSFLKLFSMAGAALVLPVRWITDRRHILIAASDSWEPVKRRADVICNGRNDSETIQRAINGVARYGGSIHMTSGTFYLTAPIDFTGTENSIVTNCLFVGNRDPLLILR